MIPTDGPPPGSAWWCWAYRRLIRWPLRRRRALFRLADQLEADGLPRPLAEFEAFTRCRPDRPAQRTRTA